MFRASAEWKSCAGSSSWEMAGTGVLSPDEDRVRGHHMKQLDNAQDLFVTSLSDDDVHGIVVY